MLQVVRECCRQAGAEVIILSNMMSFATVVMYISSSLSNVFLGSRSARLVRLVLIAWILVAVYVFAKVKGILLALENNSCSQVSFIQGDSGVLAAVLR